MKEQFRDVEEKFSRLKKKFRLGKVSRQEFIEQLKKLRLKDKAGRFWMIGAKSGKWYYFEGENWVQSQPPSLKEGKAICIYCGYENDLEAEICAGCGQSLDEKQRNYSKLGNKLQKPIPNYPYSGQEKSPLKENKKDTSEVEKGDYLIFRYLSPLSLLFFLGAAGIFIGILFGVFAGETDFFYRIAKIMPSFLQELQGTLIGGIVYAVMGGIFGFLLFGLIGFFLALFINFISSFVGGLRIRLD